MRRNLLYNCCALAHSEEWRLNIERLCQYSTAFNGRRIILLKTGEDIAPANEVRQAFAPLGECEFVEIPNDPILHEVAGFVDGLAMLESHSPDEATFYAHTKGVRYVDVPKHTLSAVRKWRNRMYDELLSNTDRVELALKDFACAGCFRIDGPMAPLTLEALWHYAGTFWWVRHDALFSHPDWKKTHQSRFGIEAYLGRLIPLNQSTCLYGTIGTVGGLYAIRGTYLCACGHKFIAEGGLFQHPVKICPKCFKRKANFESELDEEKSP